MKVTTHYSLVLIHLFVKVSRRDSEGTFVGGGATQLLSRDGAADEFREDPTIRDLFVLRVKLLRKN